MFRNDDQKNSAITTLLRQGNLAHLWSATGPSEVGKRCLDMFGGPILEPERTLFLAAAAFGGYQHTTVTSIVDNLSLDHKQAVCGLIVAHGRGPDEVDMWIEANREPLRGRRLIDMQKADRDVWVETVRETIASHPNKTRSQLAAHFGVSKVTLYRWLKEPELAHGIHD